MRQAGRYLPEYRQLRKIEPNFLNFCKNKELCCEATLQPLRKFRLDAAILFSDILNIVDAFGFDLKYEKNIGPIINNKDFVKRAPKHIVDQEKSNYNNLGNDIKKISATVKNL